MSSRQNSATKGTASPGPLERGPLDQELVDFIEEVFSEYEKHIATPQDKQQYRRFVKASLAAIQDLLAKNVPGLKDTGKEAKADGRADNGGN